MTSHHHHRHHHRKRRWFNATSACFLVPSDNHALTTTPLTNCCKKYDQNFQRRLTRSGFSFYPHFDGRREYPTLQQHASEQESFQGESSLHQANSLHENIASSNDVTHHARVDLRQDARDEWLDKVLIHRTGKDDKRNKCNNVRTSSIFETAAMVANYFLSPNADSAALEGMTPSGEVLSSDDFVPITSYPLRRVLDNKNYDEECVNDDRPEKLMWAQQMFAPLFGSTGNLSHASIFSSEASPTPNQKVHKKNKRQRINLKLTVAYRGLDFCGWEDQRHELYTGGKKNVGAGHNNHGFETKGDSSADVNSKCSVLEATETLPSVQGTLVDILDPIFGMSSMTASSGEKVKRKSNSKPIEIKVAGRTDAGVSAIAQICRIRTWKTYDHSRQVQRSGALDSTPRLKEDDGNSGEGIETFVKDTINREMARIQNESGDGGLRIRNVQCVGDDFHPTFGATCRAYAYLIDLEDDGYKGSDSESAGGGAKSNKPKISRKFVPKLDRMLRSLEGEQLDYIALSYGKVKTQTTLCTLFRARAGIVELVGSPDVESGGTHEPSERGSSKQAICIELVGDRFLRRMVRILVATALREAISGVDCIKDVDAEDDSHGSLGNIESNCESDSNEYSNALLNILMTKDRTFRAKAAPPDGLIFIGAGYE